MSQKPVLSPDAPTAVIAFAGGGGIETGMVSAGIRPIASVEYDPTYPKLSAALADSNDRNFAEYGHEVIRRSIQDCAADLPSADWFHASPVCTNFSLMKTDRGETTLDIELANAVVTAIGAVQPTIATFENVPAYRSSESWSLIRDRLWAMGYWVRETVFNAADFGVPQNRRRFIGIALKHGLAPEIIPTHADRHIGWYEAIADFIDDLEIIDDILPDGLRTIAKIPDRPLLIERVGYHNGQPRTLTADRPMWTILRGVSTDAGKKCRDRLLIRAKFIDIAMPDGTFRRADARCLARWGGFPDWYQWPDSIAIVGSIVGYSVPPRLYQAIAQQLISSEP